MKTHSAYSYAIALGCYLIDSGIALAQSTPSSPGREGKRPKFTSKIHIPVRLAAEETTLPPAGYELVFADEFNGHEVDTGKWN